MNQLESAYGLLVRLYHFVGLDEDRLAESYVSIAKPNPDSVLTNFRVRLSLLSKQLLNLRQQLLKRKGFTQAWDVKC
jgi:hypothetical protein